MLEIVQLLSAHPRRSKSADCFLDAGIKAGRMCQGYEPLPPINSIRFVPLTPATYPSNELRSFQHFRERTLVQLSTFFKEDIWTSQIVQIANVDHGIWHSVIALSSFHEHFMERGGQPSYDNFALKQYNISIQAILGSERNSSNAHIHLISCILFICIEVCAPGSGRSPKTC